MTQEQLKVLIEQAKNVAIAAHKGQQRRGGGDYFIDHIEKVARTVPDEQKPIAYLHDIVEDTEVTLEDLKTTGFPEYVLAAVDLLTHKNEEPNISYWTRISQNKDAAIVKIADMKNNVMDKPSDRQREKYMKGLNLFSKAGYDIA